MMQALYIHFVLMLLNVKSAVGEINQQIFVYAPSLNNYNCSSEVQSFSVEAVSKADCGQLCNKKADCDSFFYLTSSKKCTGCTIVFTDNTCRVFSTPGTVYYQRTVSTVNREDCLTIKQSNPSATSGVYTVRLTSNRTISVFCDMDTEGGGWTVFQYRHNGAVDFYRTFQEYTDGFGDVNDEFWLGLQDIHEMAPPEVQSEMYLYLETVNAETDVERVASFSVGSYPCFKVELINGDSDITYNHGAHFSAKDYGSRTSCSVSRKSGWWHHGCTWINPNGIYDTPGTSTSGWAGVVHILWLPNSMAVTKIMFRRN